MYHEVGLINLQSVVLWVLCAISVFTLFRACMTEFRERPLTVSFSVSQFLASLVIRTSAYEYVRYRRFSLSQPQIPKVKASEEIEDTMAVPLVFTQEIATSYRSIQFGTASFMGRSISRRRCGRNNHRRCLCYQDRSGESVSLS